MDGKKVKAIIFDLDNTLIETGRAGDVALQKVTFFILFYFLPLDRKYWRARMNVFVVQIALRAVTFNLCVLSKRPPPFLFPTYVSDW